MADEVTDSIEKNSRVRRVIVYQKSLLNYSETFIKNQSLALQRWQPILVGERYVKPDGLAMDGLKTDLLCPIEAPAWRHFFYRCFRYLNWSDPLVVAHLKRMKVDLIHAHFGTSGVEIWPYARALGIPLIVTLHGFDINTSKVHWSTNSIRRLRLYPERLVRLSRNRNVHFIAVSKAIMEAAVRFGLPRNKLTVSYIGVDTNYFRLSSISFEERPKRVLFVGRLVKKKGPEYLLHAFEKVRTEIKNAEAVIIGDGPMRQDLEGLVGRLRLSGVSFRGMLSPDDVLHEISMARLLCLPSVTASNGDAEGFGMVLLEAQACGLPVVTSALGGAQEGCLDGVTGFRFPERDVAEMAKRIIDLLKDDELVTRMSVAARSFVEKKFDIRDCVERLEKIYDKMLTQ